MYLNIFYSLFIILTINYLFQCANNYTSWWKYTENVNGDILSAIIFNI